MFNLEEAHSPPQLTTDAVEAQRRKMLFLSKRGNLESELLLVAFIEHLDLSPLTESNLPDPNLPDPNTAQEHKNSLFKTLTLLHCLLAESDQALLSWLLKTPQKSTDVPQQYRALIQTIRLNYASRISAP